LLNEKLNWKHVFMAIVVILAVTVLFSLETHKPLDTEGITVDATSVLILGGLP
jgi:hypothetical protein